jgi:hypothetical protein
MVYAAFYAATTNPGTTMTLVVSIAVAIGVFANYDLAPPSVHRQFRQIGRGLSRVVRVIRAAYRPMAPMVDKMKVVLGTMFMVVLLTLILVGLEMFFFRPFYFLLTTGTLGLTGSVEDIGRNLIGWCAGAFFNGVVVWSMVHDTFFGKLVRARWVAHKEQVCPTIQFVDSVSADAP